MKCVEFRGGGGVKQRSAKEEMTPELGANVARRSDGGAASCFSVAVEPRLKRPSALTPGGGTCSHAVCIIETSLKLASRFRD